MESFKANQKCGRDRALGKNNSQYIIHKDIFRAYFTDLLVHRLYIFEMQLQGLKGIFVIFKRIIKLIQLGNLNFYLDLDVCYIQWSSCGDVLITGIGV